MAIIGKIRSKSSWIVGILGLALLAFTFDLWKDVFLGWFGKEEKSIGMIYGEKVSATDYENLKRYQDQRFELFNGRPPQGAESDFWNDEAWTRFTDSIIINKECEALSIKVSENELSSYFNGSMGFEILPEIVTEEVDLNSTNSELKNRPQFVIPPLFKNPQTQSYTAESINQGRETIKKLQNDKTERGIKIWSIFENEYKQFRLKEKYLQLISQGIFVSDLEIEDRVNSNSKEKNITYIKRTLNDIPDNRVSVSEDEMRSFYESHRYEADYLNTEDIRQITYVKIPINPSPLDTVEYTNEMKELKINWKNAISDSSFVIRNTERPFYFNDDRLTVVPEKSEKVEIGYQSLPSEMFSKFDNVSKDSIVGPYFSQNSINISKVKGYRSSSMKIKRIQIKTEGLDSISKEAKLNLVQDTIMKKINRSNFGEFAVKYSDDQQSKSDSGLIKLPMKGNKFSEELIGADLLVMGIDQKTVDVCENIELGKPKFVETSAGIDIIMVLERSSEKWPMLLTISKTFMPSKSTYEKMEDLSYDLLTKIQESVSAEEDPNNKGRVFESTVRNSSYVPLKLSITNNEINYTKSSQLYNFEESNTTNNFIELAFSSDYVGALNEYPMMDGENYIFGMLSNIVEKGSKSFEDVKNQIEKEIINEKKSKLIAAELIKSGESIEEMSSYMDSLGIKFESKTTTVTQRDFIESKSKVLGVAFSGLANNDISLPIIGGDGVYVLKINDSGENLEKAKYAEEQLRLIQEGQNGLSKMILESLRKKADISDNRIFQNLGIQN